MNRGILLVLKLLVLLVFGVENSVASEEQPSEIVLQKIVVEGSTVFATAELERLVSGFLQRSLTPEQLLSVRQAITAHYVDKGYINSGAFLPEQEITSGILRIQVVEGDLETIEFSGLKDLNEGYLSKRLRAQIGFPFNIRRLERSLQLLGQESVIENLQAELQPGLAPGLLVLQLSVQEALPVALTWRVDNDNIPSYGEWRGRVGFQHQNFAGFTDNLQAEFYQSEGTDDVSVRYSFPVDFQGSRLEFFYENSNSEIVKEPFRDLGIEAAAENFALSYDWPLFREPREELTLGLSWQLRESQTFLFNDVPFSFSAGAQSGKSKTTVLSLSQDWVKRSTKSVLAVSSQLNLGLGLFEATVNNSAPDGRFFAWRGQVQWVRTLNERRDSLLRATLATQLTPDELLSMEKFNVGGKNTVRGYSRNFRSGDNGVLVSVQSELPLARGNWGRLQLVPFIDCGHVWNNGALFGSSTLASLGLGLNLQIKDWWELSLDYGVPWMEKEDAVSSLSSDGFHFQLRLIPLRF